MNDPKYGLDFPGGKIQEGEAIHEDYSSLVRALKREVLEETGLEIEIFDPFSVWYHEFLDNAHRNYGKKAYIVAFRCKYVSGELKLSDEHDKFHWLDRNSYVEFREDSDYFRALEKYFKSAK